MSTVKRALPITSLRLAHKRQVNTYPNASIPLILAVQRAQFPFWLACLPFKFECTEVLPRRIITTLVRYVNQVDVAHPVFEKKNVNDARRPSFTLNICSLLRSLFGQPKQNIRKWPFRLAGETHRHWTSCGWLTVGPVGKRWPSGWDPSGTRFPGCLGIAQIPVPPTADVTKVRIREGLTSDSAYPRIPIRVLDSTPPKDVHRVSAFFAPGLELGGRW